MFGQGFTCPALLEDRRLFLPIRDCHPLWSTFPGRSGSQTTATGLVRVRSPLLTESRLMSFPPANEMFQFAGFASCGYGFTARYCRSSGLPHSEIQESKGARPSSWLIAACHVLHRLSMPRHSPNALLISSPTPSPKHAHAVCGGHLPDSCGSGSCLPFTGLTLARSQVGRLSDRSGKTDHKCCRKLERKFFAISARMWAGSCKPGPDADTSIPMFIGHERSSAPRRQAGEFGSVIISRPRHGHDSLHDVN